MDKDGLISKSRYLIFALIILHKCKYFRSNLNAMEEEFYDLSSFAVDDASMEGMSLLDTVKKVKPTILIGDKILMFTFINLNPMIGLSACGGLFSKEVLEAMNENEAPPIIFPLSNPTSRLYFNKS